MTQRIYNSYDDNPDLSETLLPLRPSLLIMGQNPSRDRRASGGDPESGQSSRKESAALSFGAETPLPHILALANGGR